MALFGRKKEKTDEVLEEIRKAVEENKTIPSPAIQQPVEKPIEKKPVEVKPKPEVEELEKPTYAPLFIKLDRYRQILNAIGHLKTSMIMLKNSFITLAELDRAREETFKLLQDAMEKLEKRMSTLDQELVRPSGYRELTETEKPEYHADYHDVETVEATIADLKGQIEQLKTELEDMS